ncbi:ash family protein [Salmonella enterica subsp. houtenae serovar 44:z36,[z38]:-]|uniref:Ash family protein n=1 Tax=Salmonella enterica subsp. houtenae serovar 44:z36[z38]:- TaxID=1967609 RepID=A0A736HXQ5_SALHO|nr:ash family protein [Salmonella enterica subsp. houtenae]EEC1174511.1 hypothetical protein [Salmonella enterica]EHM8756116.1 ash family protein [Salmonella enterica subsp. houtenae serovar 44:z36,[z38]:-]HAE7578631.1 ash family protein [Salmonella enterica subsp. houtenae serovar 44:z36[z38]:-]HCM6266067.1 ash family protein [Salmonella enterica subsp. houtenae serovar 44:z36,Z38:-]
MMPERINPLFSGLHPAVISRYSFPAAAKSAAGRRNPSYLLATPDAPCVFFTSLLRHTHFSGCGAYTLVPVR